MSILYIGSVYDEKAEKEIIANTKAFVNFSENNFQRKILTGFKGVSDFSLLSAPAIGSYPNNYKKMFFKGFSESTGEYQYVHFLNVWGLRNLSRAKALKKEIKKQINSIDSIVIYSVHTPFLEAASYAKKRKPSIKVCLIVPDLPEFMNQNSKKTLLYKVAKKYDIKRFYKLNKCVDSYLLLTKPMNETLNKRGVPYKVQEGIIDEELLKYSPKNNDVKHIVYAGKLNVRFGIGNLLKAFLQLKDDNLILDICGSGEYSKQIQEYASVDKRIVYHGNLTYSDLAIIKKNADVFVNPRLNNDEYTKYSFPSKNIEYLVTGKPTVAYLLDGMDKIYGDIFYVPSDDSVESLAETIQIAAKEDNTSRNKTFIDYARENLMTESFKDKIIELIKIS